MSLVNNRQTVPAATRRKTPSRRNNASAKHDVNSITRSSLFRTRIACPPSRIQMGMRFKTFNHAPARASAAQMPLPVFHRSEDHTSELQTQSNLVCRLLLEKKNITNQIYETFVLRIRDLRPLVRAQ